MTRIKRMNTDFLHTVDSSSLNVVETWTENKDSL
jgi:hypothetical protein